MQAGKREGELKTPAAERVKKGCVRGELLLTLQLALRHCSTTLWLRKATDAQRDGWADDGDTTVVHVRLRYKGRVEHSGRS